MVSSVSSNFGDSYRTRFPQSSFFARAFQRHVSFLSFAVGVVSGRNVWIDSCNLFHEPHTLGSLLTLKHTYFLSTLHVQSDTCSREVLYRDEMSCGDLALAYRSLTESWCRDLLRSPRRSCQETARILQGDPQ